MHIVHSYSRLTRPPKIKLLGIVATTASGVRQRYFRVDTLKELFEILDSRNIIAFIKDINFYHYI